MTHNQECYPNETKEHHNHEAIHDNHASCLGDIGYPDIGISTGRRRICHCRRRDLRPKEGSVTLRLLEGIATPKIEGTRNIEFDEWPESLEAIAAQLGTLAAKQLKHRMR